MKDDYQTFSMACLLLVLLLGFMYYVATPARSQEAPSACGPKDKIDKRIWTQFGESPVGIGITNGGILYVTANPVTGTFTIIMRRPDGVACVMMGGTGWADVETLVPGRSL